MRFLPLLPFLLALLCGGCASSEKRAQKEMARMERAALEENSRTTETRRMRLLSSGEVTSASKHWAEVVVWDPNKTFDPNRNSVGTARTFGTGGARTKDFHFKDKVRAKSFEARDFSGAKANAAAERKFATNEANTNGKYAIPNVDKDVTSKAARTKELWDGTKVAATRDLPDGQRQYLGRESKNLGRSVDPKEMANWRSGGGEQVIYNNATVDRVGTLKQLSIEDVRELLNKNK